MGYIGLDWNLKDLKESFLEPASKAIKKKKKKKTGEERFVASINIWIPAS